MSRRILQSLHSPIGFRGERGSRYVGNHPKWLGGAVLSLIRRSQFAAIAASFDVVSVIDEPVPVLGQVDDIPTALLTAVVVATTLYKVNRHRDLTYEPVNRK